MIALEEIQSTKRNCDQCNHTLESQKESLNQPSMIYIYIYDNFSRNLNKCWAQLEAKVTPTSDELLTSNLFYSRTTTGGKS